MGLSNYQLVLLDNIIYLDSIVGEDNREKTLRYVVYNLLYENGDPSNGKGSGAIKHDCINQDNGKGLCMMSDTEWVQVLEAIEADETLCSLKIHNVANYTETGFRAATFISDATEENVIIFRGTSTVPEWFDNGTGGYMKQTVNQKQAVDYVDSLDIVNNYAYIASGHSKGGNLAQYETLMSTDASIDKCEGIAVSRNDAAQSAVQEHIITSIVRQIICSMTRSRSVAARSGT
ncbi:MAG: DUF2974 domain-containing protein [Lachnospiraceae bacterium]|nr:DUF2974 domain-containing protein [Lachnospiraceae bacterium]